MLPGVIREVGVHFAAVHGELAGTCTQENARDGFFAATRAVEPGLAALTGQGLAACNRRFSSAQRSSSNSQERNATRILMPALFEADGKTLGLRRGRFRD